MTHPTLIFLHALGGSAQAWRPVGERLGDRASVALDLPGFGDAASAAAAAGNGEVGAMADWVVADLGARGVTDALLVGHSMGGKIATLLAARAQAGAMPFAVHGVVLVAASPPAPEPMDEARRARMIDWFADGLPTHAQAAEFIDANTAAPLIGAWRDQAIADVLRTNPAAWRGWLERGSREDWRDPVGRIDAPALILAGAEDGDLGVDAQRRWNLPHYPAGTLHVVAEAAHLIPYEQPDALAALIRDYAARCSAISHR